MKIKVHYRKRLKSKNIKHSKNRHLLPRNNKTLSYTLELIGAKERKTEYVVTDSITY